jgi:hypothetical protein
MTDEIKVHLGKYPDLANLVMRYVDAFIGRQVQRWTGTADQKSTGRRGMAPREKTNTIPAM